jgi:hypothetical protein
MAISSDSLLSPSADQSKRLIIIHEEYLDTANCLPKLLKMINNKKVASSRMKLVEISIKLKENSSLGIGLLPTTQGLLIGQIDSASQFVKTPLKVGMQITQINDISMMDSADVRKLLRHALKTTSGAFFKIQAVATVDERDEEKKNTRKTRRKKRIKQVFCAFGEHQKEHYCDEHTDEEFSDSNLSYENIPLTSILKKNRRYTESISSSPTTARIEYYCNESLLNEDTTLCQHFISKMTQDFFIASAPDSAIV